MNYHTSDPVLDAYNYFVDLEDAANRLPICSICDEHITRKGVFLTGRFKSETVCDKHITPVDDELPATCSYCGAERDMNTEYLQHEDFVWVGKTGICLCLNCLEEGRKEYEHDRMAV